MKTYLLLIFILPLSTFGYLHQLTEHKEKLMANNTRNQKCRVDNRTCIYFCDFQGEKIFPGEIISQAGKCRQLRCDEKNFSLYIKTCYMHRSTQVKTFVPNGQFIYTGENLRLKYPDCCGKVVNLLEENSDSKGSYREFSLVLGLVLCLIVGYLRVVYF
ncbi:hypothetical protein ACKWTF_008844 [Chironomus riparius]